IGSNDLTQLALGVDRDSKLLAHLFDERDPGVKRLIEQVIRAAHQKGRKVGICGQAPSDYPEFARWLVEIGIDSISLNPDAIPSVCVRLAAPAPEPSHSPDPDPAASPGGPQTRVTRRSMRAPHGVA
ncbi:MAG TPA: putative PEP-binding protein, partial [Gemmatimonadales bacterium]|nr:putative PEP-binding protein [Gemmatimonadales bacterium]